MNDDISPEERLQVEAKEAAATPPEPVEGAEGLPYDVRNGRIDDAYPSPLRERPPVEGEPQP